MSEGTDVVVVGAGPYGLSLAAQLAARGVEHRIFGTPLQFWRQHMPRGMLLKSEGFASCLYDRKGELTLGRYCLDHRLPYQDLGLPVPLGTFCRYGLAFQRQAVPHLEQRTVVGVRRYGPAFGVDLDDGEVCCARRVVIAAGIGAFAHLPAAMHPLPSELVSHSSAHHDLSPFRDRDVTVLGGGASAIDLAALLHEQGAHVRLVARSPHLAIHTAMRLPRPLIDRVREPLTGIGPSWRSWLYVHAPLAFRHLPEARRVRIVRNHLGPAGGWYMADRVAERFPILLGHRLADARVAGCRLQLRFTALGGASTVVTTDHVIAATGYRPDVRRLGFLGSELVRRMALSQTMPQLSSHFESTVPGLYFAGPISANSFGPVMRFAYGAKFTTPRLARHLARTAVAGTTVRIISPVAAEDSKPDCAVAYQDLCHGNERVGPAYSASAGIEAAQASTVVSAKT